MKSKHLLLTLLLALLVSWAANAQTQSTLPVCNGTTTTSNVPIRSGSGSQSEFIYPASMLSDMEGGTISSVKFFSSSTSTTYNYTNNVIVYVEEVASATESSSSWSYNQATATKVYEGTTLSVTNGELVITFSSPYQYNGGNLCFNIWAQTSAPSVSYYYQGQSYTCAGWDWSITPPVSKPYSTGSSLPKAEFTYTPSSNPCKKPLLSEDVALTLGDGTVASLTWTEKGEAEGWTLQYGTDNTFATCSELTSGFSVVGTTVTADLTGLAAEQKHYARVKPDCDTDGSKWSNTISFTPTNAYTFFVNENATNTNYNIPFYYSTGSSSYSNIKSQFIIPSTDLTAAKWGTIERLTFFYNVASSNYGTSNFSVYMAEVNNTTLSTMVDWTTLTEVYTGTVSVADNMMTIELDSPFNYQEGNLLIGFKLNSTGSNGTYGSWVGSSNNSTGVSRYVGYGTSEYASNFIPKMKVEYTPGEMPTCWQPQNLTYDETSLTQTEVTLNWERHANGDETEWVLQYGTDETFGTGTYTQVTVLNNPTKDIDGLTADTKYYARVKPACDTEGELWSEVIDFQTLPNCVAPVLALTQDSETAHGAEVTWTGNSDSYTLEYRKVITAPVDFDETYDFNDNTMQGWTPIDNDGDGNSWTINASCARSTYTPSGSGYNANNWLISPQIPLGGTISFNARQYSNNGAERFQVFVSTTGTDISDFTAISDVENPSNAYQQYNYSLSDYSGQGYVAIVHTSTSAYEWYVYIDDINISAHIDGEYDEWQTVSSATTPHTFTTLDPETMYEVRVKGICDNDESDYSNTASFTTTATCPATTNLIAGTTEARSVALIWNENGEANAWQICLNGDEDNLIDVVANFTINDGVVSYTLNGLTPETDYTIKVRAYCGEEDQSLWSNEEEFSTEIACPVPTTLNVTDETTESALLTWEAGDTETAWNIQLATYNAVNETWSDYVMKAENFSNGAQYPINNLTQATTYRVQVQAVCGGEYNDMSEWSNYFEFSTEATCFVPENFELTEDSETAFGATLTWEGESDHYIVEYREPSLLIEEDFTGLTSGIPTGWGNSEGTTTTDSYKWNYYNSGHVSAPCLRFNSYNNSKNKTNFLMTPAKDLQPGTTAILKFWWMNPTGGDFSVYVSTDGGTTKTPIAEGLTGQSTWKQESITLTDYVGATNLTIHFKGTSNYGNGDAYIYLDEVVLVMTPGNPWIVADDNVTDLAYTFNQLDDNTAYEVRVKGVCTSGESQYSNVLSFTTLDGCPAPTDFTLGEVTESTAAFSWTQPTNGVEINEWVVKYRKSGETEWLTINPNPTTPSATIENLDENSGYEVVIAPACNEEKTLEGEFDTPCAIYTLPYTYGFEDAAEFDCWTMTDCNSSSGIYSSANHSGNKCFYFYYEANSQQCLISPEFNCTTEMGVSFYYKNSSTSYDETFHVGYSTTTNDVDAFTWGDEIFVDKANTSWLVYTNIFPVGTKFVAIKHTSDDAYYLYLDDFTFAEPISLTKEIEPYTGEKDNYYLIASPLAYDVDPTTIEGMTEADYDLYYFDQTQNLEWRNHKDTEVGGYKLINGKGYLYANNTGNDITFAGVPYVGNGTVTLTKTENAEWSGWNLVGNPFSTTATIERGFYRMNEETGDEIIPGSGEINVMEGVFVEAESNGETMTFSTESGVVEVNNDQVMAINLNMDNILLDRAMVYFGGERKLSKFQLNPNHTKVYIPMEGKDYAVVSAGEVGEMPVNFKAEKNGSYTLSFTSQEVTFNYLHLIDNMTGNDVDLLKTPSYTFDATTTDYAQRFRLVFATGSSVNNDNFGFVNAMGNLCIFGIEGEATLQVIDVTGRVISSNQFSGSYESKLNVAPGVYMLRLINGNDVKVQKIVME